MKIVVDKKITKLDGDVEDILSTSQIVEETEDIRTTEMQLDAEDEYTFAVESLKGLYIEGDQSLTVELTEQGSTIVMLYHTRCFSFVGTANYTDVSITNNSSTDKAKIKIVVVE